jgi:hypothetical protein
LPDGLFSSQTLIQTKPKPFEWNFLISFMTIGYTLWPFASFYGNWVYVVAIYYNISHFGILCKEKSGNPASESERLQPSMK